MFLGVIFLVGVSACAPTVNPTIASTLAPAAPAHSETAAPSPTQTATNTDTPTPTASLTATATPTDTPTPIPAVTSLRARVIVANRLACRFGPGAPYLFKYSFAATANIELVGRMEFSHWVLARAIGGTNRCWVNGGANYLQINGDPLALPVADPHIVLPWSDYYGPMSNVSATRSGNLVTVTYSGIVLVPDRGDDSEQIPYVLEAWVCQGGQHVFIAVGSYSYSASVTDESGCAEPSHARVFAAEKHGYTPWVGVPWPPAPSP